MQLLYSGKAKEAGVYIIGACGFDSIPSDMGVAFTKQNFSGKFLVYMIDCPPYICLNKPQTPTPLIKEIKYHKIVIT